MKINMDYDQLLKEFHELSLINIHDRTIKEHNRYVELGDLIYNTDFLLAKYQKFLDTSN